MVWEEKSWCSPRGNMSPFLTAFKIYLFVLSFQKFNYAMSCLGFLWLYPTSWIWRFMSFALLSGRLQPLCFQMFVYPYSVFPPLGPCWCECWIFWYCLQVFLKKSVCPSLSACCCSYSVNAVDLSLSLQVLSSVISALLLYLSLYFQFYSFHAVLSVTFISLLRYSILKNLFHNNFQLILKHVVMAASNPFSD